MLNNILKRSERGEAEPRLLGELGRNTIESVFYIGIYDASKELIGKGIHIEFLLLFNSLYFIKQLNVVQFHKVLIPFPMRQLYFCWK